MKIITAILLLVLLRTGTQAQQKKIDSLLKELKTVTTDTNRLLILGALSRAYYQFKPDTALILAQEGYDIALKIGFRKGEALSLNRIASCYTTVGDYPKALQFFIKALAIAQAAGDEEGIGRATNNLGDLYMTQGDYHKALEYFHKA